MRVLCLTLLVVCVGLSPAASANLQEKKRLVGINIWPPPIHDFEIDIIVVQALRDQLDELEAFLNASGNMPSFLSGGPIRDILESLLGQDLTDALLGIPLIQQLTKLVDWLVAYLLYIILNALYEVLDALVGLDLTDVGSVATFLQSVSIIAICLVVDVVPNLATVVGDLGISCS